MDDGSEAAVRQMAVDGRPSPARRFSDPTFGETLPAVTPSGRHSSSSTASPARGAPADPDPGPSSSAASPERSSVATLSVRSPGGLRSRGRRGVGAQRARHEQGSLLRSYAEQLRSTPVQGESFCRCPQQGQSRDLHCMCGEDDHVFEWTWDEAHKSAAAEVSQDEREVRFHINYSSGTAAVCGTQVMADRQYFWEVKMTTPVYGTDMMVGVGTANVDMDAYRYNFCSFLGRDSESWGLSYYGKAQSRGVFTDVAGARFGQGSIIGVHLDTWLGRLMFYKNRKPLGVVFSGLRGKLLYPMVASTAARTGMKLVKACSYSTSLQFLCCCVLREIIPPHLDVTAALNLPPGLHDFLLNNLDWLLRPSELSDAATPRTSTAKRHLDCSTATPSSSRFTADESRLETSCKRPRLAPLADGLSDFDDVDDEDDYDDGDGDEGDDDDDADAALL